MLNRKVGIVGCGKMGGALARALIYRQTISPGNLHLYDIAPSVSQGLAEKLGVMPSRSASQLCKCSDLIILAVKPHQVISLIEEVAGDIKAHQIWVSVAAGITLAALRAGLGDEVGLVRAMPNRPALVASGITGMMGDLSTDEESVREVESLFQAAGETVVLECEEQFDAVTGVSGSGPGFVFRMIEGLVEGGIREGLSPEVSLKLAIVTVRGAGELILQMGTSPVTERKAVSSPNGTTVAGLAALGERGFKDSVIAAVQAAAARSRELGQ